MSIGYKGRLSSSWRQAKSDLRFARGRAPGNLRNPKNFACVRIFHFRAGRESFYIDEFAG